MALPLQPVTLNEQQIEELSREFSGFRHDVNGCLSLVVAAAELIRYNPEVVKRMATTLTEQPPRIAGKVCVFIDQCERTLALRNPSDPAWNVELARRVNAAPGSPENAAPVDPNEVKAVHNELLHLAKEMMQMGFMVSGARTLLRAGIPRGEELAGTALDQLIKVSRKFEQATAKFESVFGVQASAPRRLASGAPSGPVTLSADAVALFHRRLKNLERDIVEHLKPLIELSHLARIDAVAVQARAAEFAEQPPKISREIADFAVEFDRIFGIVRQT